MAKFDPTEPLSELKKKVVEEYFAEELNFMAPAGYAGSDKAILRRRALQLIFINSKTETEKSFDAIVPYHAMNYFDRFITSNRLPVIINDLQSSFELLVISCLSLAWKTRNQKFSLSDFLSKRNLPPYNKADVEEMEFEISTGLGWRMRPVTAFCFVDYYLSKVKRSFSRQLITNIIIATQGDISFTQFKPSVIAAAAVSVASVHEDASRHEGTIAALECPDVKLELQTCINAAMDLIRNQKVYTNEEKDKIPPDASSSSLKGKEIVEEIVETPDTFLPSLKGKEAAFSPSQKGKEIVEEIVETGQQIQMHSQLRWLSEAEEQEVVAIDPHLLKQLATPPPPPPPPPGDQQENAPANPSESS